ncbi:MAG TPA: hydantoinase [Deltaproteobacteria bacterium]|nr:hydantoinase [Deltaproteobacteria bacterium]
MLIGIDVGGTYTDGVLFSDGSLSHSVKHPTDEGDLKNSLLGVLDELLADGCGKSVKRVVLGTTLVTNLLATRRTERTALMLVPGSGMPFSTYDDISPDTYFLKGGIDFRGREIEPLDREEVLDVLGKINGAGIGRVAVAGKFSNRNDKHEAAIKQLISERFPHMEVCTSNAISGQLNFPRRAVTCYYTAMTTREWNHFADGIGAAIEARLPGCELHILKADGGTTTLEDSRKRPCETMFSGPAGSTVGALALCREPLNSVVVDIGGTTSDISLLIAGQPLYASKGACVGGRLTHIHSFAVDSIAIGGDSPVTEESGRVMVGTRRLGAAACFGGEIPTVTDAFNVLMNLSIGNAQASNAKLTSLAERSGQSLEELCRSVQDHVVGALKERITHLFHQWENEPAYRVWEVVHQRKFVLQQIIGIGAAAPMIVPALARDMGVNCFLHRYSPVANALGAAVARPTLAVAVHVDTQKQTCTISPGGLSRTIDDRVSQMPNIRELARSLLKEIGLERGLGEYSSEAQFYLEEQFNVIRGPKLVGKIFDVGIQIAPGLVHGYEGVAE